MTENSEMETSAPVVETDASSVKQYFDECRQVLQDFTSTYVRYQKECESLQIQNVTLQHENEQLVKTADDLKLYVAEKIKVYTYGLVLKSCNVNGRFQVQLYNM